VRNHGYTGSYSSVHRFLSQLAGAEEQEVPLRLIGIGESLTASPSHTTVRTGPYTAVQ
jgi:hypothetical protein